MFMHACVYARIRVCMCVYVSLSLELATEVLFNFIEVYLQVRGDCQVDFHCSNLGAIMGVYEHTHAHKRTNTHTHTQFKVVHTKPGSKEENIECLNICHRGTLTSYQPHFSKEVAVCACECAVVTYTHARVHGHPPTHTQGQKSFKINKSP